MIYLNLNAILKARNIERPLHFLVKNGFNYNSAHLLLNTNKRELRLDHLEKLCHILYCSPSDLFVFQDEKKFVLSDEHPLNNLKYTDLAVQIHQHLKSIPLQKLKEIDDLIKENLNPDLSLE